MSTAEHSQHPLGAYDTDQLVGRSQELAKVYSYLDSSDPTPVVLFVQGPGGIGKSRFLRELVKKAGEQENRIVAQDLIDLYHVIHHTTDGLMQAVYQALPDMNEALARYEREWNHYQRMVLSGNLRQIGEQHERVRQAFVAGLKEATQRKRLLLVLDTAERAVYTADPTSSSRAPLDYEIAESWRWLVEILPELKNLLLLVAGREQAMALEKLLSRKGKGIRVDTLELNRLSEEESLAYFRAMADTARRRGDEDTAERIESLDESLLRRVYRYANGLPILLALVIDWLNVIPSDEMPEDLISDESDEVRERLPAELESRLIERIRYLTSEGDTIDALGRAPKGVDAQLLARLRGISEDEARRKLEEVKKFTFVKVRPSDKRVFLHDVMYEILGRQLFTGPQDAPHSTKANEVIIGYYNDKLGRIQEQMQRTVRSVLETGEGGIDLTELARLTVERQTLLAETLYYRLRQDPGQGFHQYYRYMREAILSGQVLLDVLLQTELVSFWAEQDPAGQCEALDGFPRDLLRSVLAIRPVTRAWAEGRYKDAVESVEQIQSQQPELFQGDGAGVGTRAIFDAWRAYSHIYLGSKDDLKTAQALLDAAVEDLENVLHSDSKGLDAAHEWRTKAVLGFVLRVRGYLHRVQGDLERAVKDYRKAVRLWRDVNVRIEQARTLNDLGFALAELGQWEDGRALVRDALAMQEEMGLYSLAGLSINTLAHIAIREGEYASAADRARRALALFRALGFERGAGLALTALAEANRRRSVQSATWSPERKIRYLREARDWAQEAVEIFRREKEKLREIEALIEVGCACRDWLHLRLKNRNPVDNPDHLLRQARRSLERAAEEASSAYRYRQIDALVNLAWLYYYAERDDDLQEAIRKAEEAIPPAYVLYGDGASEATTQPSDPAGLETSQPLIWLQQGKLQVLKGVIHFDNFQRQRKAGDNENEQAVEELQKSARFFTLGFEYDRRSGQQHQGLRQAKETVYARWKKLDPEYLQHVAQAVIEVENELGLDKSAMREFLEGRALWYGDD